MPNKTVYPVATILLLLGMSFYPAMTTITLRTEKFSCGFRDNSITLQWIHSVEREMWQESYRITGKQLLLFQSQFKTFGAGTPYSEPLTITSGLIETYPNIIMPQIYWIISRNVASTILTTQGIIPIHQYFDDYTEITITVQNNNIWTRLKDTCHDKFTATS